MKKFEIELKQTVQFDSEISAVESFCDWLIGEFIRFGKLPELTRSNINILFSNYLNETVYKTPYDVMTFTSYQAQIQNLEEFLNKCVLIVNQEKQKVLQEKKNRITQLEQQITKLKSEII